MVIVGDGVGRWTGTAPWSNLAGPKNRRSGVIPLVQEKIPHEQSLSGKVSRDIVRHLG